MRVKITQEASNQSHIHHGVWDVEHITIRVHGIFAPMQVTPAPVLSAGCSHSSRIRNGRLIQQAVVAQPSASRIQFPMQQQAVMELQVAVGSLPAVRPV